MSYIRVIGFLGLALAAMFFAWRWDHEKAGRALDRAAYESAQLEADRAFALRALEIENGYRTKAKEAEHEYKSNLADAHAAARRYMDANRVLRNTKGTTGNAAQCTADRDTAISEGSPETAILVSEQDFLICTNNSQYALSAYNWAQSLGEVK